MEKIQIKVPEELKYLAFAYRAAGGCLYIVGGAVRNALLRLPYSDIDITGCLLQDSVEKLCRDSGISCVRMSTELGTLRISIKGQIYEYTPFRAEEYGRDGKHRPEKVLFGVSMEEDAKRRDFTVNALYADAINGMVQDPLGGLGDIQKRLLRCCAGDTLESDALRIMRLIRFSGELGFHIEENTFELAKRNANKILDIAGERILDEFSKILLCDVKYKELQKDPYESVPDEAQCVYACLKKLEETGVTEKLFPELMEGNGIAQRSDYHKYTILEHAYHSCSCAVPELTLRLAALFHDIGKPVCLKETGNYHMHMVYGESIARVVLARFHMSNAQKSDILFLIRNHMYDIQNLAKKKNLRKSFAEWGRKNTRNLILIREADIRGSGTRPEYFADTWRCTYEKMLSDGTPFTLHDLKISGTEIMKETGIREGEAIGQALDALRAECILHPKYNNREKLFQLLRTKEIQRILFE